MKTIALSVFIEMTDETLALWGAQCAQSIAYFVEDEIERRDRGFTATVTVDGVEDGPETKEAKR